MKSRGRGIRAALVAGIVVLVLWTPAAADHAGVTFSQVSAAAGGTAIQGVASGGVSLHPATGVWGRATASSGRGVFGVAPSVGVEGLGSGASGVGVFGRATAPFGSTHGVRGVASSTSGVGVEGAATATSGFTAGVVGSTNSPFGAGVVGSASGTGVGVFAVASGPGGGIALRAVGGENGGLAGSFDGDVEIIAGGHLFVHGTHVADLAEDLPVAGPVAAGDVVVLAQGKGYGVARAARPYDTRVAGIISAKPRVHLQVRQGNPTAPVAMVGLVKAKATAANGSIVLGDLLTTSRVPGHLMRCPRPVRCVGAIVGKALEPLSQGKGEILVLLWRQ